MKDREDAIGAPRTRLLCHVCPSEPRRVEHALRLLLGCLRFTPERIIIGESKLLHPATQVVEVPQVAAEDANHRFDLLRLEV